MFVSAMPSRASSFAYIRLQSRSRQNDGDRELEPAKLLSAGLPHYKTV